MVRGGVRVAVAVAVLVVWTAAPVRAAKPAAPRQLGEIFRELREFEEAFEAGKWDEAKADMAEIQKEFKGALPVFQKSMGAKIVGEFTFLMDELVAVVQKKDSGLVEHDYVALQKLFVKAMEGFEYKVPPGLEFIAWELDELDEAMEENDLAEVLGEAEEIEHIFDTLRAPLEAKKVPAADLDAFRERVLKLEAAGKARDKAAVKPLVDDLRARNEAFRKLF